MKRLRSLIKDNDIKVIINCAAYTAVDKAEFNIEMADKINHLAVVNMARIAKNYNIKLTDYVFNGENFRPYIETDITNPQGIYGATKLASEKAIQSINHKSAIISRYAYLC